MDTYRLISWNVNGLRAVYKKNFLDWFSDEKPDFLCLQETKSHADQLPDPLKNVPDYHVFFSSGEKRGYSGVALYSRIAPKQIMTAIGIHRFDSEGRILIAEYESFTLCNIYFPNGKASGERLQYKMDFYEAFLEFVLNLKNRGERLVICGDVNTAHRAIDLARPRENEKISGFLPEERAWIDRLIANGFVDTFRIFTPEGGHYTWWDMRTRARDRDIGWRIDYFYVSENLRDRVKSAFIRKEVMGSDHCPLGIDIQL